MNIPKAPCQRSHNTVIKTAFPLCKAAVSSDDLGLADCYAHHWRSRPSHPTRQGSRVYSSSLGFKRFWRFSGSGACALRFPFVKICGFAAFTLTYLDRLASSHPSTPSHHQSLPISNPPPPFPSPYTPQGQLPQDTRPFLSRFIRSCPVSVPVHVNRGEKAMQFRTGRW